MICMQNDAPASGSGRSAGISLAKHLSFTAVLAALCCVSTVFFVVPLPASGYFNMGDVFVLLSGWLLGPLYGAAAAGLGTMLADVVGGYASYAPATLVIKAVMAVAAYFVSRLLKKAIRREKLDVLPRCRLRAGGRGSHGAGLFLFRGRSARHGHGRRAESPRQRPSGRLLFPHRGNPHRRDLPYKARPRLLSQARLTSFPINENDGEISPPFIFYKHFNASSVSASASCSRSVTR